MERNDGSLQDVRCRQERVSFFYADSENKSEKFQEASL